MSSAAARSISLDHSKYCAAQSAHINQPIITIIYHCFTFIHY
eukprot:COSAG03_NODE_1663_length_3700_cov_3.077756_2_plen_42_part_00